jgi:cytochrome c biogenesis protein CcdA
MKVSWFCNRERSEDSTSLLFFLLLRLQLLLFSFFFLFIYHQQASSYVLAILLILVGNLHFIAITQTSMKQTYVKSDMSVIGFASPRTELWPKKALNDNIGSLSSLPYQILAQLII